MTAGAPRAHQLYQAGDIGAAGRQPVGLLAEGRSPTRLASIACVALPTCPQAMAEAILDEHGKDHDDATCVVVRVDA